MSYVVDISNFFKKEISPFFHLILSLYFKNVNVLKKKDDVLLYIFHSGVFMEGCFKPGITTYRGRMHYS